MENNLSIVLPVFNEQEMIKGLIDEILARVSRYINDFEVIAVNDGSSDNTSSILKELQQVYPNLKVVSHPVNQGYGSALSSGIKASSKDWILMMDSDGQFRIDSLESFWEKKQDHDFVLGYREKRTDNLYRLIMGKAGNLITNIILKKRIIDINCGFKLFKRQELAKLQLTSTGGLINFEVLYLLFKNNSKLHFTQMPVTHYPRKYGKQTGGKFWTIFKILKEGARLITK